MVLGEVRWNGSHSLCVGHSPSSEVAGGCRAVCHLKPTELLVSHLHRRDLVHLGPHGLHAVEDFLLVSCQRHAHSEDVPEEKSFVSLTPMSVSCYIIMITFYTTVNGFNTVPPDILIHLDR